MSINRRLVVHPEPMTVEFPSVYVVSVLADASGRVITKANRENAFFIKTEMFDDADAAWAVWDRLVSDEEALFVSCQNETGESIV